MQHCAPGEHPLHLREGQGPGRDHQLLHSQADNEGGGLVPVETYKEELFLFVKIAPLIIQ